MSYSYRFRLTIIKQVTEQDFGIREVAKRHKISHSIVISWLKAFREKGLEGVKSPYTNPKPSKIGKPKMKKKEIDIPEPTDLAPKAFKKLQREKAAIALLYQQSKQRDGYRPLTLKLRQIGFRLNHKTVLKLMNTLHIHSIIIKSVLKWI